MVLLEDLNECVAYECAAPLLPCLMPLKDPPSKKIKRADHVNSAENKTFVANAIHSALIKMGEKIKHLSKSAAELETALESHRDVPFVSSAYSLSEPLPFGDTDFSISNGKKSVNLPAKSVAEVNDLNEILDDDDAHNKAVRKVMVSHTSHIFT